MRLHDWKWDAEQYRDIDRAIQRELEARMYVYVKSHGEQLWTVGFYTPSGEWEPESDHATPEKAAERVHYLNGGK